MAYQGFPPVLGSSIADNSIENADLQNSSVTEEKIADDAVTTDKIADDAITNDKMSSDSIGSLEIVDDAVTTNKIVDDAVTNAKILDGEIDYNKLASAIIANQAEAEAGTVNDKLMTPLTSKQLQNTQKIRRLVESGSVSAETEVVPTYAFKDNHTYYFEIYANATASAGLNIQLSTDNGITYETTNYNYNGIGLSASLSSFQNFDTDSLYFGGSTAGNVFFASAKIFGMSQAVLPVLAQLELHAPRGSTLGAQNNYVKAFRETLDNHNSLRFTIDAGTITGSWMLYEEAQT